MLDKTTRRLLEERRLLSIAAQTKLLNAYDKAEEEKATLDRRLYEAYDRIDQIRLRADDHTSAEGAELDRLRELWGGLKIMQPKTASALEDRLAASLAAR